MKKIEIKNVCSLQGFVRVLTRLETLQGVETERYFRGEPDDYEEGALTPSIYTKPGRLENEPVFYREMQRFNDQEFRDDKTTFDKLSRMQHYSAPTRLIDMSEDALSALYFALNDQSKEPKANVQKEVDAVVYVIDVVSKKLRYYDSDAVSVVANLVKSPLLFDGTEKNKQSIARDANKYREDIDTFNQRDSIKFLLHDIKEEKPYFSNIIDPKHIFSVQCVKPKFTHSRINSQKGAFLLFGINPDMDIIRKNIRLIEKCGDDFYLCHNSDNKIQHPIERITKIVIKADAVKRMKDELESIGIKTPFIYPEMDKVAEYLKATLKTDRK